MSDTNNEIVRVFLEGKPLGELRRRGLNVIKIFGEVSISDVAERLIDDGTGQMKGSFEQRKQLILKVLDEMIAEIGNLCTHRPNTNGTINTMANGSRNSLPPSVRGKQTK